MLLILLEKEQTDIFYSILLKKIRYLPRDEELYLWKKEDLKFLADKFYFIITKKGVLFPKDTGDTFIDHPTTISRSDVMKKLLNCCL